MEIIVPALVELVTHKSDVSGFYFHFETVKSKTLQRLLIELIYA